MQGIGVVGRVTVVLAYVYRGTSPAHGLGKLVSRASHLCSIIFKHTKYISFYPQAHKLCEAGGFAQNNEYKATTVVQLSSSSI